MVRKRGPLDRIERIMSKKRSIDKLSETPEISVPQKRKKNLLNDRILSLYKADISTEDKSSLLQNEEEMSLSKPPNKAQTSETPETSHMVTKIAKKRKSCALAPKQSTVTFKDVGGLNEVLTKVFQMFFHLIRPEFYRSSEATFVRGILLHGPPGCGKSHLARAIAGQFKLPIIEVSASELVGGVSGESESKIRDIFEEAVKCAPSILFIDQIDAVCPKREVTERSMEKRMVSQLIKCLDELKEKTTLSNTVTVIGATNTPDTIDPALRCGGRFDRELAIGMPDENARLHIFQVLRKRIKLAPDFDVQWLAHHTPGYVGADLNSLAEAANEFGILRICQKLIMGAEAKKDNTLAGDPPMTSFKLHPDSEIPYELMESWFMHELENPDAERADDVYIEQQDFELALENFTPLSKREGFPAVPDVTWDDVGALKDIQEQLQDDLLWPVKYSKKFEKSRMSNTKGMILYGPKGCGKTVLAKAIANEGSINFLSVKGPELLNMYLGESEKAVRQCFQRARNCAPCVIFFDELDALCPTRSGSNTNAAADRVVNQLLTEMDGLEERKQVFVIGATNRIENIDSAMLRPGRLEKEIYVDIPSFEGRVDILIRITKNKTRPYIAADVDFTKISEQCENFSGADLAYLVKRASSIAMRADICSGNLTDAVEVQQEHFDKALEMVKPSVTKEERKYFEQLVKSRSQ